ncbi:orotate phosphoribosyltransferase [Schleiferia thermophila]|jgi:orotate phosphoribosyltransferase|uniref:Orotate phosphoribosyltransferase n=1 Tax=Schleiferia thermophila TaxID=884107 RepID=A0A369A2D0_9FLAO|nr:orotate phosphoribosyltransferase [Schleiferia thermophila]KFD39163.1 orotate phosphoribosyltransferase [Schleiferia thermophila str. Yellowstone]RCX03345.1 orotate phosphoribosyltransferase [Schleiferia thermophila]GCD80474.1 orotate phosphoribosyltransferase [Schleiferia thermophila]
MNADKDIARKTAEFLIQINAIQLNLTNPFLWTSGLKSPIYCDNRIILSYPAIRTFVRDELVKSLERNFPKPEIIAGVATGAIAIGALVADQLGLPFVYVRPEPKAHGRKNQIEGTARSGQNVMVIEDLISTGKSSLNAIDALKDAGLKVLGVQAIFTYGFKEAHQAFERENLQMRTLSNYDSLLETAQLIGYITEKELEQLQLWKTNPADWGNQNK